MYSHKRESFGEEMKRCCKHSDVSVCVLLGGVRGVYVWGYFRAELNLLHVDTFRKRKTKQIQVGLHKRIMCKNSNG